MMPQLVRLTRWEWFKLRHRWMPWILLAIVVIASQAALWGDYSSYHSVDSYGRPFWSIRADAADPPVIVRISCGDIADGSVDAKLTLVPERYQQDAIENVEEARARGCEERLERDARDRDRYRGGFVLPSSLANGLGTANTIGVLLIMILASSAMGVEYGWGTLRTVLTRGTGRWRLLGAKVLSLLLLGSAGFVIVGLGIVVSSLIAASLISGDGGGLADSGRWSAVAVMFGKAVYGLAPYVILALFLSVLTSSSSIGIAVSLAYLFVELTLIGTLSGLVDWLGNITDFLLGPNAAAWMTEAGVSSNAWIVEDRVFTETGGLVRIAELPGQLHSFLVLAAYIAVLCGAALWIIRRRDIAGAKGE